MSPRASHVPERGPETVGCLANPGDQRQRIGVGIEHDGEMPSVERQDEVEEPPVAHEQIVESTAVDLTAAAGELDEDGVDHQLVPALALRRGARGSLTLAKEWLATAKVQCTVANRRRQFEDRVEELLALHAASSCIRGATHRVAAWSRDREIAARSSTAAPPHARSAPDRRYHQQLVTLNELRALYANTPARDAEAFVEVASALIVALVDELEDAEADKVLDRVVSRIADQRSELAFRRQLARALDRIHARDRALVQLGTCVQLARIVGDAPLARDLGAELDAMASRHEPTVRAESSALVEAAEQVDDPEVAAGLQLALARQTTGDTAIAHARQSLALAYDAVDPHLVAEATGVLCELLVARDDLAEARTLLEQRPLVGDGRADRALYDEIRRRLGESVPEPPDEPDEVVHVNPAVLAYVTRSPNPARSISEGGLPATFKVHEWAPRTLTTPAELESQAIFGPVRSFWCACGRLRGREYIDLTCPRCGVEIVHTSSRRTRTACIVLAAPVVHPWHAATAGTLLELTPDQVLAMPVEELRTRLDALDLDALAARFKHEIVTAPKMRVADQAGRRLALVDAFRHAGPAFGTSPSSIILELVLVVPPAGDLGFDREKVRAAYARVLEQPRDTAAVVALFDAFAVRP